ncbi:tetratricopeptide repeat protein [Aestuariibacter sp. A3R04]|uniref:tetratricopeptide repeat protein n=1 Tax=Aestuariibacter sp. A3R04 TaxID=2841571 RepID=UPI001C081783|nr:SEL1-like repeat protein [Aestuariibacter sp. A3R04]MBU3020422.1 SEL1-like repeat protein [Aestuariibacter sp. A3R04]
MTIKKLLATAILTGLSAHAFAVNVLKANTEFKHKNYALAVPLYLESALLGNAHAQYQLGVMYSKGLGVETDAVSALVYFSLAAEKQYYNAEALVNNMLSSLDESQLMLVKQVVNEVKQKHLLHQQQYLPELNHNTLDQKVTFDGNDELERNIYFEALNEFQNFDDELNSMEEDDVTDLVLVVNNPGFLVVENDVASDGSVRYVSVVQKSGNTQRYLNAYKLFPLSKPVLNGKPAAFVHRAYLGAAISDQFTLNKEIPSLYRETRRIVRTAKSNPSLASLYEYAMAMVVFPWMQSEAGEAEALLKQLAVKGHPAAMYEYGMQLYLSQKAIPEAIHWITEASKFGLVRAEYRLGKLLLSSPWVIADEKKALFWFESAMKKGNDAAALHTAKIKLTSADASLLDVEGAIQHLDSIVGSQNLNPEYYYLLSLSYRLRPERDFKRAVEELERAISMGRRTNWDTSEWEASLAKMLEGSITVTDF